MNISILGRIGGVQQPRRRIAAKEDREHKRKELESKN
jgi:hypothetical protein